MVQLGKWEGFTVFPFLYIRMLGGGACYHRKGDRYLGSHLLLLVEFCVGGAIFHPRHANVPHAVPLKILAKSNAITATKAC